MSAAELRKFSRVIEIKNYDKEFYGHTKKYCELEKIEMTKTKSKDYPLKDFQKFDETLQAIGKQIIDLSNYFPNKNDESKLAAEFTKFYLTQSKKPKHLQTPHLTANTISSKLDSLISLCSYSSLKHVHIGMLSEDRETPSSKNQRVQKSTEVKNFLLL